MITELTHQNCMLTGFKNTEKPHCHVPNEHAHFI